MTVTAPYRSGQAAGRDGFAQLLRAEWTKFRPVRGWIIGLLAGTLLIVGLGALTGANSTCSFATAQNPNGGACPAPPAGPDGEWVTDSFYFVRQPLAGNGSITVRVTSLTGLYGTHADIAAGTGAPAAGMIPGTQPWSKAGIIIKASTAQGSAYAAMMVTGSHGVRMRWDFTHAQVERRHKPATPALIAAAAKALSVDVTELTGQPYRGSDARSDRIHAAIPEIRRALAYWDVPPELDLPPRPLAETAIDVGRVNRLRMEAGYAQLGELLPRLIMELAAHVHQLAGTELEQAFRLLSQVYTAVDSMAYKLGYMDLFALAVERMAWAAWQSDDPLLRPVAAMRRSSVFLATGGWDGGMTLLERAGREIDGGDDDATLSVSGTMHLRSAILAARANRPAAAWDSIGQAAEVSGRLGRDTRDYGLLFGPTNVAIHGVAVAVELGDADEAIRRGTSLVLPDDLPRERSSHHYIDLSRAWMWQRKLDKALACVITAERLAPQRTRYHPMARQTISQLLDQQRRLPEPLRGVATRMGLP